MHSLRLASWFRLASLLPNETHMHPPPLHSAKGNAGATAADFPATGSDGYASPVDNNASFVVLASAHGRDEEGCAPGDGADASQGNIN